MKKINLHYRDNHAKFLFCFGNFPYLTYLCGVARRWILLCKEEEKHFLQTYDEHIILERISCQKNIQKEKKIEGFCPIILLHKFFFGKMLRLLLHKFSDEYKKFESVLDL